MVVFATQHFHKLIAGRKANFYIDRQPLLGILDSNKLVTLVLSPRMACWCVRLSSYDYDLMY